MQDRWTPYIKPTRKLHDSGFKNCEVGYMVGYNKADKVVVCHRHCDVVNFPDLSAGAKYLKLDITSDGYIRFNGWMLKFRWSALVADSMTLEIGEPPAEELERKWKESQEEK